MKQIINSAGLGMMLQSGPCGNQAVATGSGLAGVGLGCGGNTDCGCGGGCGGGLMGFTNDGSGLFGTGIFGTGVVLTDPSTWGPGEWFVVAAAGYTLISVVSSTRRLGSAVKAAPANRRKRRAAALRAEANELSKKKGLF